METGRLRVGGWTITSRGWNLQRKKEMQYCLSLPSLSEQAKEIWSFRAKQRNQRWGCGRVLFLSKLSKSVSGHDNDSPMLPPASALRANSSLLASLFVGSELRSLRLAGNNSAGGSSLPSVANNYFGERTMILNSKVKRRPSNFSGANVAGLVVFEVESILPSESTHLIAPLMLGSNSKCS